MLLVISWSGNIWQWVQINLPVWWSLFLILHAGAVLWSGPAGNTRHGWKTAQLLLLPFLFQRIKETWGEILLGLAWLSKTRILQHKFVGNIQMWECGCETRFMCFAALRGFFLTCLFPDLSSGTAFFVVFTE